VESSSRIAVSACHTFNFPFWLSTSSGMLKNVYTSYQRYRMAKMFDFSVPDMLNLDSCLSLSLRYPSTRFIIFFVFSLHLVRLGGTLVRAILASAYGLASSIATSGPSPGPGPAHFLTTFSIRSKTSDYRLYQSCRRFRTLHVRPTDV